MKPNIILFLRVFLCALILIGGTYGVWTLTVAMRDGRYVGFPDYSFAVSGTAVWGIAFLVWWATNRVSEK